MPTNFEITPNPQQLADLERDLKDIPSKIPAAISAAMNKTARSGAAQLRQKLAAATKAPTRLFGSGDRGNVRPLLSNQEDLKAGIRMLNFNIPLNRFGRVALSRGMMGSTSQTGELESLPNFPFRVSASKKSKGGGPTGNKRPIFVRLGKSRLPIAKVFGASPRKAFEIAPALASETMADLGRTFDKNLTSQTDRILNRKAVDRE